MTTYIATRLALMLITILGLSFIAFSSIRLIPGDIVDVLVSQGGFQGVKSKEQLRERMGLHRPIPIQYVDWGRSLITGDLGRSLRTGYPIASDLKQRVPVTLELGALSVLLGTLVGVSVGAISAITRDSWLDYILRSFSILMLSIPGYWIATLVLLYLALWFSWSPPARFTPLAEAPIENLKQVMLPAAILGVSGSAPLMRYTRTAMLEVLHQDYIRTAKSKGLSSRAVITRHALRNALIPVITVISLTLSVVLGGSVIFETIFALPGMGSYLLSAVIGRDYPQVQVTVLIYSSWVVLLNFLTDLAYSVIDPRIRY